MLFLHSPWWSNSWSPYINNFVFSTPDVLLLRHLECKIRQLLQRAWSNSSIAREQQGFILAPAPSRWMQIEEHFLHRHVRIWAWRCLLQEIPHTRLRVHVQVRLPRPLQWCFQWGCEENATLACHCCCTLLCDGLVSSAKGLRTTRPNHTKACRKFLQSLTIPKNLPSPS